MKLTYTISKCKGENKYYAHKVGYDYIPVVSERGTFVDKKTALHIAADSMGLPYKDYMKLRRTGNE